MKIEKLFFISSNKMLCTTIDLLGKEKKMDFFTIDNVNEAKHFIHDLKPDLILIDADGFLEEETSEILNEFLSDIPVVLLSNEQRAGLVIKKPLSPMTIIKQLEELLDK